MNAPRMLMAILVAAAALLISSCRGGVYTAEVGASYASDDWVFYPSAEVYYSPARDIYFYYDRGTWIRAQVLPPVYRTRIGSAVRITYNGSQPYSRIRYHRSPEFRAKYQGHTEGYYRPRGGDTGPSRPGRIYTPDNTPQQGRTEGYYRPR